MKLFSLNKLYAASIVLIVSFIILLSAFVRPDELTAIGTRTFDNTTVNDTVTASTVLHSSALSVPVAANQKIHIHFSLPFRLSGTTPGIKFQVTTPSGGTLYNSSCEVFSDADSLVLVSVITSVAAQGTALATIGNHYADIEFTYTNGATAGNVTLQFAQNTSDAALAILLAGAFADVVSY